MVYLCKNARPIRACTAMLLRVISSSHPPSLTMSCNEPPMGLHHSVSYRVNVGERQVKTRCEEERNEREDVG